MRTVNQIQFLMNFIFLLEPKHLLKQAISMKIFFQKRSEDTKVFTKEDTELRNSDTY